MRKTKSVSDEQRAAILERLPKQTAAKLERLKRNAGAVYSHFGRVEGLMAALLLFHIAEAAEPGSAASGKEKES